MLRPQEPYFHVQKPAVQQQRGGSSCGLFALTFSYALCKGARPELCRFNERRLRAQLYTGLIKNTVQFAFEEKEAKANEKSRCTKVQVYCLCRTAHNGELMVQCTKCTGWHHPTCTKIPSSVFHSKKKVALFQMHYVKKQRQVHKSY